MQKNDIENAISMYPEGRKIKLNGRFSQFSNFAHTAVLLCTAEQMAASNEGIKAAGAKIQSMICDENRINQSFFKGYATVNGQPCLSVDGAFLLYDFVRLMKNLRNLWLTERVGELEFILDDQCLVARWQDLRDLFNEESKNSGLVKIPKLTEIAIYLKVGK